MKPGRGTATVAAVGAGGFAGGVTRRTVDLALPAAPGAFPWSTVVVNTAGAFALVLLLVVLLDVVGPRPYLRLALGTGFLGALTTFSAVVVGAERLAADGAWELAVAYLGVSLAAAAVAATLALGCGRRLARRHGVRTTGPTASTGRTPRS